MIATIATERDSPQAAFANYLYGSSAPHSYVERPLFTIYCDQLLLTESRNYKLDSITFDNNYRQPLISVKKISEHIQ